MKLLGPIVRLQIQRASLKAGQKPDQHYDPAPLWSVQELTITAGGALAWLPNGDQALDIHNAEHPQTKSSNGVNDLSVGFTAHYAAMREKFGAHLADGIAGENILVNSERAIALAEITNGLAIKTAQGWIRLRQVQVALPCAPFSKFAARNTTPGIVKDALQFLDDGIRGFYCIYENEDAATMAVGDEVWTEQP